MFYPNDPVHAFLRKMKVGIVAKIIRSTGHPREQSVW